MSARHFGSPLQGIRENLVGLQEVGRVDTGKLFHSLKPTFSYLNRVPLFSEQSFRARLPLFT